MKQEKQNKSNQVNPDQILRRQMERRAAAALRQHKDFARAHQEDSREDLLAYVRRRTEDLGRTPFPEEITGSPFLASQFAGGWAGVINAAGLPPLPGASIGVVRTDRASEFQRQVRLHRRIKAEKREKKEARQKKKQQQTLKPPHKSKSTPAQKRKAEKKALQMEVDMAWGQEHEADTDEQLLDYIRRCAGSLPKGQALRKEQVLGGYYIEKRFHRWAVALSLAGLPLPEGFVPATTEDLDKYARLRAEREANRLTVK